MTRTTPSIKLRKHERRSLTTIIKRGTTRARTQTRARILDLLHRQKHSDEIASLLQVSRQTVFNIKRRYLSAGFDAALFDQARSGRPVRIDGAQRARITALACSHPPTGYARWSLRLLADKAVELQLCDSISHNAVKEILKKTLSSLT